MGLIYKSAVCNISTTESEGSHTGLFRSRNIETLLPLEVSIKWPYWGNYWKNTEGYVMVKEDWCTSIDTAPLNTRGWGFQERILSPRTIQFGAHQLFWDATNGYSGNEQWPNGIPFGDYGHVWNDPLLGRWMSLMAPESRDRVKNWTEIVEDYSERKLTYDTDKLAAMSGVASEIQNMTGNEYFAGIWKEDLLSQLLWKVRDPEYSICIQPYTAPTWSWASINGSISYNLENLSSE